MTYKTLVYIHSLLALEERAREEEAAKARGAFDLASVKDENYDRVKAFYDSASESLYDARCALDDFVNANWHC